MKIEHLLARHLYSAKQLTLQGIGTFTLPDDFVLPAETDKITEIPQGAITFTQNTRAVEDDALIDFIVQHSRKMKALASSDLDSFISLGTQFLNIGKPLKIEGIGILEKTQLGNYQFTQYGQIVGVKAEETPVQIKEKKEETISFAKEATNNSATAKKIMLALLALLILAAAAWAVWHFFFNKKAVIQTVQQASTPTVTPVTADTLKKDSLTVTQKPDTVAVTAVVSTNGSYTFKVVIKNYPSLAIAQKRLENLTTYGHKLVMYTSDSVTYKIAMPFTRPLADTTYAKDSLRKFFNAKTYIELK